MHLSTLFGHFNKINNFHQTQLQRLWQHFQAHLSDIGSETTHSKIIKHVEKFNQLAAKMEYFNRRAIEGIIGGRSDENKQNF